MRQFQSTFKNRKRAKRKKIFLWQKEIRYNKKWCRSMLKNELQVFFGGDLFCFIWNSNYPLYCILFGILNLVNLAFNYDDNNHLKIHFFLWNRLTNDYWMSCQQMALEWRAFQVAFSFQSSGWFEKLFLDFKNVKKIKNNLFCTSYYQLKLFLWSYI